MTFTQLAIFAKVAALGSFTTAADQLGISQSAVSHAIRQLEKEWDVKLFIRTQQSISLSSTGKQLLVRTNELLTLAEGLTQEVADLRGVKSGTLRIGSMGISTSIQVLPKILEKFKARYPGIEVIVEEGKDHEVAEWIRDRKVDIGFVVLPNEQFHTTKLIEDALIALIPAQHPLAKQTTIQLADLCKDPFILTLAGSGKFVEQIFEEAKLRPDIKHKYAQIITIIKIVEMGSGVSIVADLAVPDEIMQLFPGVIKKPLSVNYFRTIGLAIPHPSHASPATTAFLQLSKQLFAKK